MFAHTFTVHKGVYGVKLGAKIRISGEKNKKTKEFFLTKSFESAELQKCRVQSAECRVSCASRV